MKSLIYILGLLPFTAFGFVGGTVDPDAVTWKNNCVANGSDSSSRTVWSVNRLSLDLKYKSIWTQIYAINPLAGTGILSAAVKLKYPSGVAAADVNSGSFVSGDFVERGSSRGITGNGSSKYTDTGINPTSLSFSTSSASLWCWVYTTAGAGTSQGTIGVSETAGFKTTVLGWINSGSLETGTIASLGTVEYATGSATSLTGFIGVCVSGSRSQQFYQNGAAVGSPVTASGGFANATFCFSSTRNDGTPVAFATRRLGQYIIASGYSALEISKLYSIVNQFNTEMLVP